MLLKDAVKRANGDIWFVTERDWSSYCNNFVMVMVHAQQVSFCIISGVKFEGIKYMGSLKSHID